MREFAKISPSIWRSRKVKSLENDIEAKLLYFYFLTSPHSNSIGCYDLPIGYGSSDLGWERDVYRKAMDRLSKAFLIEFDIHDETLFIVNWATFNPPTNPKHALGMLDQLKKASSVELRSKAASEFLAVMREKSNIKDSKVMEVIESLLKGYQEPIETPETETRDRDLDRDQTKTREKDLDAQECATNLNAATPKGASGSSKGSNHLTDLLDKQGV